MKLPRSFVIFFIAVILTDFICKGNMSAARHGKHSRNNKRSVRSYDKRSVSSLPGTVTLQTLTNASIMMCSEAMTLPYARMVQLNDEQMQAFLHNMGGNYVKDYMATTQEEALENFPNMLVLTRPVAVDASKSSLSLLDNIVAKQTIVDDLNKLTAYLKGTNSTTNKTATGLTNAGTLGSEYLPEPLSTTTTSTNEIINESKNNISVLTQTPLKTVFTTTLPYRGTDNTTVLKTFPDTSTIHSDTSTVRSETSTVRSETSTVRSDTSTYMTKTTSNSTQQEKLDADTSTPKTDKTSVLDKATSIYNLNALKTVISSPTPEVPTTPMFNKNTRASIPGTLRQTVRSTTAASVSSTKTSESAVTAAAKTSTLDPDILSGLEQLKQYVQGTGAKRDIESVWRNANTTLHPSTLLRLARGSGRTKRNADGTDSREEYCQNRGALTEDRKFVHMCTVCAATTKLSDDMFPRYVNEAVCKIGDTDCFTIAGTSHGQCKQTKFSLNMLRKKTGHCNMLLHGGETLVFENWELVPQMIRVSCECTINKLSVFSQYIAHDVPLG